MSDFKIKDITLADWGRKEISIAENVPASYKPYLSLLIIRNQLPPIMP